MRIICIISFCICARPSRRSQNDYIIKHFIWMQLSYGCHPLSSSCLLMLSVWKLATDFNQLFAFFDSCLGFLFPEPFIWVGFPCELARLAVAQYGTDLPDLCWMSLPRCRFLLRLLFGDLQTCGKKKSTTNMVEQFSFTAMHSPPLS